MKAIQFILFITIFFMLYTPANSQHSWVQTIAGDHAWAKDIATDRAGNVYVIGSYNKALLVDEQTFKGSGEEKIFLAKLNADAHVQWLKQYAVKGTALPKGLLIDESNNIYLCIDHQGTLHVEGEKLTSKKYTSVLVKYNNEDEFQWAKSLYAQASGVSSAVVDNAGNLYFAGLLHSTQDNAFISKHDTNGNNIWIKRIDGAQSHAFTLAIHNDELCASGSFAGNMNWEGQSITATGNQSDIWLAMLSTNGDLKWLKHLKGSYDDVPISVCIGQSGEVVLAGSFKLNIEFAGRHVLSSVKDEDVFVAKYDNDGNFQWARQGSGGAGSDFVNDMVMDIAGNVLVLGSYNSSIVFDNVAIQGPGTVDSSENGSQRKSLFIVKIRADGSPLDGRHLGSTLQSTVNTIHLDQDANIILMMNLDEFVKNTATTEIEFGDHDAAAVFLWKTASDNQIFFNGNTQEPR